MNLYVHFPFCRTKCAYCALHSRPGAAAAERAAYSAAVAQEIRALPREFDRTAHTVYFGGGTPALCDLAAVAAAVRERLGTVEEFTVELHPEDVAAPLLAALRDGGVNRISLGVQSFSDPVLNEMRRRHDAARAAAAFRAIRAAGFDNAGLDLIAGWPGVTMDEWRGTLNAAVALEPAHISVYSLIREERTALDALIRAGKIAAPDDAAGLDQIRAADEAFAAAGLERYEISNWARPGRECRHNCAVWRGEDYFGLGEGASGRLGRRRTFGERGGVCRTVNELDARGDALERVIFRLRTKWGVDLERAAREFPALAEELRGWGARLETFASQGLARRTGPAAFALTARGLEVCDAILAELV